MLWANIIMDALACLALATELSSESILKHSPVVPKSHLVDAKVFKHIIGQAYYQIIVVFILLFAGDKFIPEERDQFELQFPFSKFSNPEKTLIVSGRYFSYDGKVPEYINIFKNTDVPSRHFTIIFNTFILMNIFNLLNARKIKYFLINNH